MNIKKTDKKGKKTLSPPQIVFILGIKHSGKSSISKVLSKEFSYTLFDLDEEIIKDQGENELRKNTIRELYTEWGNELFHKNEYLLMKKIAARIKREKIPSIISLGGGVSDNMAMMKFIKNQGVVIFLHAPETTLFSRIASGGIPPFLDAEHPEKSFHELFIRRTAQYHEAADIIINQSDHSIKDIVEFLLKNDIQSQIEDYYG